VKTSVAGVEAAGKKTFCTSAGGSGATRDPKHALNLFGSDSSASDGEAASLEQSHKHSKETPLAEDLTKSFVSKGIFE
jgi:hypothetical protein